MRSRDSRGQALAEFILVIPLFLVVLLGVVQFSLVYFAYQMVHYASFAATRAAIVRPCAAFHPNDSGQAHFTPSVFTAAVLVTMAATPPQCLLREPRESGPNPCQVTDLDASLGFLPALPGPPASGDVSDEVAGLDFSSLAARGELALTRYINAAYLTSVQRVESSGLDARPMVWTQNPLGPGPGIPCEALDAQAQNVPPPGSDVTLEVTLIYPLTVPLVNRVIYGVFVNFSSLAQDRLNLEKIIDVGPESGPEDVMVTPTRLLPFFDLRGQFTLALQRMFAEFGYSDASLSAAGTLAERLADRAWYPLPVRGRCTLTVEGSAYSLTGPPTSRGW